MIYKVFDGSLRFPVHCKLKDDHQTGRRNSRRQGSQECFSKPSSHPVDLELLLKKKGHRADNCTDYTNRKFQVQNKEERTSIMNAGKGSNISGSSTHHTSDEGRGQPPSGVPALSPTPAMHPRTAPRTGPLHRSCEYSADQRSRERRGRRGTRPG